jgi:hypothetical protein
MLFLQLLFNNLSKNHYNRLPTLNSKLETVDYQIDAHFNKIHILILFYYSNRHEY